MRLLNVVQDVRRSLFEALKQAGLTETVGSSGEVEICQSLESDRVVIARVTDWGSHIVLEIRFAEVGVGSNLVSALLMLDAGDLWVSSDLCVDLNGRIQILSGDEPLLKRLLQYVAKRSWTDPGPEGQTR